MAPSPTKLDAVTIPATRIPSESVVTADPTYEDSAVTIPATLTPVAEIVTAEPTTVVVEFNVTIVPIPLILIFLPTTSSYTTSSATYKSPPT